MHALVAGGGIFGVTAALALAERGHTVTLVDPGLPHPLAESTDISKIVRIDYGADEDYTALGERALDGWRRWNARWPRPLFHETGVTFLSRAPLAPGGFEYESAALLARRGHAVERLDAAAIARRFPAYRPGALVDGYYNPIGGWAEASAVVAQLAAEAAARGVAIRAARVEQLAGGGAVIEGELVRADLVIVCAGSWVPLLVPALAPALRAVGQPVFHLRPADPRPFEARHFPVFGADIARTGYYGFPVNADGVVKIANHGTGTPLPFDEHRDSAGGGGPAGPARDAVGSAPGGITERREVSAAQEAALRAMVADTFPALAGAPIVHRRLCVYCDTADEHFWIARDPARPGVVVATGGSGHAFKFAPALGDLIATIALGEPHPLASKFRWRPEIERGGSEAARFHG